MQMPPDRRTAMLTRLLIGLQAALFVLILGGSLTHIYRLRRKLGPAAALLATEEGGYRLSGAPGSSRSTITGT